MKEDDICFAKAISTMRLALGYKEALPPWFQEMGRQASPEFIERLKECFPDHQVRVWGKGETFILEEEMADKLVAFAYVTDATAGEAHIVIGNPVAIEGVELHLLFVLCVGVPDADA